MICPNCKKEVLSDAKICTFCKADLSAKPSEQSLFRKYKRNLVSLILLIIFVVLINFIYTKQFSSTFKTVILLFLIIFIIALCFSLFIELIRFSSDFFKIAIKRPALFLIPLLIVLVVSVTISISWYINKLHRFERSYSQLILIQDLFSETVVNKSYVDDINAAKVVPEGISIELLSDLIEQTAVDIN